MQNGHVARVAELLQRGDLGIARVGKQVERLVGVGRDDDAVHPRDLPGDVAKLDAVLAPGDIGDRMGRANVALAARRAARHSCGSSDDAVPLRRTGDPQHAVMVEELEQVAGRVHQRRLPSGRPDAGDDRNGVVGDEVVAEPFLSAGTRRKS